MVRVEIADTDIARLINVGYLDPRLQKDLSEIESAVGSYFGDRLLLEGDD